MNLGSRAVRYARGRLAFAAGVWFADLCPLIPPWSQLRRDTSDVSKLRRVAIDVAWRRTTSLPDRALLWLMGATWPVTALIRSVAHVAREGRTVQRETGKSLVRQWYECVAVANSFNYAPRVYYQHRFYKHTQDAGKHFQLVEFAAIQIQEGAERGFGALRDKGTFFEHCRRAGLPTAPILAILGPGPNARWIDGTPNEFPRGDLFLKWVDSEEGVGAERWTYDGVTQQWARRGRSYDHAAMLAYCHSRASKRALVVQPAITNHPDIQPISGKALSTLRVMTYRDPGQPATLIRASFKAASPTADTDNVSAGGMSCAMDPATGVLGRGFRRMPSDGEFTHHPVSGAQIKGTRLSIGPDAVRLALRAHEALDTPWTVGWDVALTPHGPMLIEGNPQWGVWAGQVPHESPLPPAFVAKLLARVASEITGER